MRLAAAILVSGIGLLAGANAQNATYDAQRLHSSMFTPASSPAKCSPDGWITVTQINPVYETQWKTTTYTEKQPEKTVTTCTGSVGGYGSTRTVTATATTSLPCTKQPTTVTSYQNCIPVSHDLIAAGNSISGCSTRLRVMADYLTIESYRLLSKAQAGRKENRASASILQYHHSTRVLFTNHQNRRDLQVDSDCYRHCDFDQNYNSGVEDRGYDHQQGNLDEYQNNRGYQDQYRNFARHVG